MKNDDCAARHVRFLPRVALLCVALLGFGESARAGVVDDWNVAAANAGAVHYHLALLHVAMHDTLSAVAHEHDPIAVSVAAPAGPISEDAALVEAAYRVLKGLSARVASPGPTAFDGLYGTSMSAIPAGPAKDNGIALGASVAAALLAARSADGWPYAPVNGACPAGATPCGAPADPLDGTAAGKYRRTPPTGRALVTPWLPTVRTFFTNGGAQFRADGPPSLDSAQYAEDYAEVKRLGGLVSERNAEQTAIATFHTVPPFRFWTSIVRNAAADHGLTQREHVRLEALVWVAAFDTFVSCWDSKYHYYSWRPYTAIADPQYDDNNPATTPDPGWRELAAAPPHPEYPSGHSCGAGTVTTSLEQFFGTKKLNLRGIGTLVPNAPGPTVVRMYPTTTDLSQEIVDARVWTGIHFRTADTHGVALGRRVTKYVLRHGFGESGATRGGR